MDMGDTMTSEVLDEYFLMTRNSVDSTKSKSSDWFPEGVDMGPETGMGSVK